MVGAYKIDGIDMYTEYGVTVEKGSDDFVPFPDSKTVFSRDFKDQNGKQYWLDKRFFDRNTAVLSISLSGDNEVDFWKKRDALGKKLMSPGERVIYITEANHFFRCFYISCRNTKRLTRIKVGEVVFQMDLVFQVIEPHSEGNTQTSFPYTFPFTFN